MKVTFLLGFLFLLGCLNTDGEIAGSSLALRGLLFPAAIILFIHMAGIMET